MVEKLGESSLGFRAEGVQMGSPFLLEQAVAEEVSKNVGIMLI